MASPTTPGGLCEEVNDLVDDSVALRGLVRLERVHDAGMKMRLEELLARLGESALDGGDLLKHVNAVLVLLDHPDQASSLALDPAQPG